MNLERLVCPSCGSDDVSTTQETEVFTYGAGDNAAQLSATLPVHHCANCRLSYTGDDAEMLRHEAVCAHLGVLKPREIRAIREGYGLTQAEFAEITRLGKASLSRWEGALLIQNQANDNFLYLLMIPENLEHLKARVQRAGNGDSVPKGNVIAFRGRFRIVREDIARLTEDAAHFELYPVAQAG
jgi:putative zinc finger/helix-turn-helix YgiT family protein